MTYANEVAVKEALGIESWRNLSKDTFLRFLSAMPDMDKEVALGLIGQIPELTRSAQVVLDDAAKAHDTTLASNDRSQELHHQVGLERLAILRAELDKDLSPEERMRVFAELRDVHAMVLAKDTENKKFLADQFDKRLGVAAAAALAVAAAVFAVAKSGQRPGIGAGGIFSS